MKKSQSFMAFVAMSLMPLLHTLLGRVFALVLVIAIGTGLYYLVTTFHQWGIGALALALLLVYVVIELVLLKRRYQRSKSAPEPD